MFIFDEFQFSMSKTKKALMHGHENLMQGNEKYQAAIIKVRSKHWSGPLGQTMSFTGQILKFADQAGAPFAGMLGSALMVGSQVLNPDPSLDDIVETEDQIKALIEIGFQDVSDKFVTVQNQLENLRKTAQKTLNMIAEMKWKEGLKRVQAYCKNISVMKNLEDIINYIEKSFNFFVEIQTDATQNFDIEKLSEYMTFLFKEQGIEECFQFFNYAMGLKSQFLSVLVLYHSYNNDLGQVMVH